MGGLFPGVEGDILAAAAQTAADRTTLPIDDRNVECINAALAGRPDLMAGRTSLTLAEGMTGMGSPPARRPANPRASEM